MMYTSSVRRKISTLVLHIFSVIIVAQLVVACSGGETATGLSSNEEIDSIIGPITASGSVVVNGIQFDTSNSQITVDSEAASKADLSIGMIVEIKAHINEDRMSGTAISIDGKIGVKGFISQVCDREGNRLSVMGQTIMVDDDTILFSDDPSISEIWQLTRNSYVEVSGYTRGEGVIYASLLRHKLNTSKITVKGVVKNYVDDHFDIGGLPININSETIFDRLKISDLLDGLQVSIESTDVNSDDGLDAAKITKEGKKNVAEGDRYKIDGIVTLSTIGLNNQFELAGLIIVVDDVSSTFENGSKQSIEIGAKLRLDGVALLDGTILADNILFVTPATLKIRTNLLNISDVDSSLNSVILINRSVKTDVFTIFKDDITSSYLDRQSILGFSNLAAGDVFELRLYVDPNSGGFSASKVTRKKYDARRIGETELEGFIENNVDIFNETFSIDGIAVNYREVDNELLLTDVGKKVKVRGYYDYDNDILMADTFSFRR